MKPLMPSPLAAVVFDMDGLLLDTEAVHQAATKEACAQLGYEISEALQMARIGRSDRQFESMLLDHFGLSFPLPSYRRSRHEITVRMLEGGIPVKPGAATLLQYLAEAGVARGLATSAPRATAIHYLTKTGLLRWFDSVVTSEEVAQGKPSPDIYLRVAELLDVSPPSCLVLEDSYSGVQAACAADMPTIIVPDLLEPTAEIEGVVITVCHSLDDVRHLIEGRVA